MLAENRKVFGSNRTVAVVIAAAIGILIPNITGLISNELYSLPGLLTHYLCFAALGCAVWYGGTRLIIGCKTWIKTPDKSYYKRMLLLLIVVIMFTVTVSYGALFFWLYLSQENQSDLVPVKNTVLLFTLSALFLTNLYENFFLNREYTDTLHRVEQLNLAKTHAELVALKNQIDPHFIFNSLNTLSYLISSNPVSAKLYNNTLAKVYQYILMNRDKNFVTLVEEIEFMSNYFYLLKIRFDNAVNMCIEIDNTEAAELLIPPISLQILMENVMKHNNLCNHKPLTIKVAVAADHVWVKNEIHTKSYPVSTLKVGLSNLDSRYKLLTGKNILIQNSAGTFAVRLPLINVNK